MNCLAIAPEVYMSLEILQQEIQQIANQMNIFNQAWSARNSDKKQKLSMSSSNSVCGLVQRVLGLLLFGYYAK